MQGRVAMMLEETQEEDLKAPAWEHTEDIEIRKPSSALQWEPEVGAASHVLYFDGGCKKQQGSGGYLLFTPDGLYIGGSSMETKPPEQM